MSSSSTSSLRSRCCRLLLVEPLFRLLRACVRAPRSLPYFSSAARFRSYARSAFSISTLCLLRSAREGCAARLTASFSACHCALSASDCALCRSASSFSSLRQPLARGSVVLLFKRLAFDLELHDAAKHFVELRRHRVDFGPQLRGRLVDQVDRLVRQKAVRDVAVGQDRRRDQGGVLDAHAVMDFVALLQAAQDRDRVLDRRLIHEHRLETALERGVLFDVLAVFVERGGADAVQLAAREHGLEQVAGVHGAFGFARADDGVEFVDEQNDLAFGATGLLSERP